ncbi:hypothetical protein [Gordonia sp. (in: high G+C Gram-positive bacteria)]|uniref:hypothetical protein n=1 Tax=Gordonia sp. (in: high G+C Gram-positive bacteria) TaxID=84139 RepID=UPI003526CAE4
MATSQARKNRRRRKAGAAVAVGATAALMAGTMTAPPAHADIFPLSIGSIGDALPPGAIAACDAGDAEVSNGLLDSSADCTGASPWLFSSVADAILGIVAPDIAGLVSVGGLNGALATSGAEIDLGNLFAANLTLPGKATIGGSGYSTAITLLGGESTAKADYLLAGAVAVAAAGGIANAESLFGVSVASAIGRPATQILGLGSPRVENSANAKSLPFGIAIANSSLTLGEAAAGLVSNVHQYRASTVALGGITAAYRSLDGSSGAVCTAAYGEARVHEQTLDDSGAVESSKRTHSCTSVLFIFQKQQNEDQHGGYVVYAIKNPLDIGLVSPFGDNIADLVSEVGGGILDLGPLNDVLAGKFVPEFKSDLIRVVMTDSGPQVETDLFEWISGIINSISSSTSTQALVANPTAMSLSLDEQTTQPVIDDEAGGGDVLNKAAAPGEGVTETHPMIVNDAPPPSVTPDVVRPNDPPEIVVPEPDPTPPVTVTGGDTDTDTDTTPKADATPSTDAAPTTDTTTTMDTTTSTGTGTGAGSGE